MRLLSFTAAAAATISLLAPAGAADNSPMTITPTAAASAAAAGNAGAQSGRTGTSAAASAGAQTGASMGATDRAGDSKNKKGEDKLARGDRRFVEKAAQGGMMEVELGKLAQQKAAADSVKSFGGRMVEDHGKANAELMTIATTLGVEVPKQLDKSHQREVDKLAKLEGAEFDKRYMKMMVADHKKDVNDFEKASKSLKNAELKNFASSTLPTLKDHLKLAQTTEAEVRKTKSPG